MIHIETRTKKKPIIRLIFYRMHLLMWMLLYSSLVGSKRTLRNDGFSKKTSQLNAEILKMYPA